MSKNAYTPQDAVQAYTAQAVEGATPGRLTLMLFDHVLACLRRKDVIKAKQGIVELMSSLDLDYLEVAGPLYRIYEYCLDIVRVKKFDEAGKLLDEVRQAWEQVVNNVETTPERGRERLEL